jgi:NADH dehydrogenase
VEAAGSLMTTFPDGLQAATMDLLKNMGVDVWLNTQLTDYDGQTAMFADGRQLEACTLIWTAGVRAAELANKLGVQQAASGRIRVIPTLQLPQHPEVFVIGDAAYLEDGKGRPLPMLATVAQQEARLAAKNIQHILKGEDPEPFQYEDPGLLATIGRNAAVARIGGFSFSGFTAWVIWVVLHIFRLIGFRNRLAVLANWAWDYFFYDNQVRLITRE